MSSFKIITCCNRIPPEPYYVLPQYIKSLQNHEAIVLSEQFGGRWTGLGSKPKWLYKAIIERLVDTKYILFTDCWDFVFSMNPDFLVDSYIELFADADLVISAEKNCFPSDLKEQYDALPHSSSYRYLNSGMIVGKTDALLVALEAMDLDNVPDDYRKEDGQMEHINDQFLWQQLFLKQPVKIELDYNQILCNTLHSVTLDELDFSRPHIQNKETGTIPCSFHANGNAKTSGVLEPILNHLKL